MGGLIRKAWYITGASSSVLAPSSKARSPTSSFLFLVAMPGAPSSVLAKIQQLSIRTQFPGSQLRQLGNINTVVEAIVRFKCKTATLGTQRSHPCQ